jgi:hydroxypyruvate reductase
LRDDAIAIWKAGVAAVDSERLVRGVVHRDGNRLLLAGNAFDLGEDGRIVVVGAGKAGAGMARGFEAAVGDEWLERVTGWVNVPEDCVQSLRRIVLHGARPAGVNEPTEAGVVGSRKILEMVGAAGPRDVCVVLLSGGGSALLPAPVEAITLEDKQKVTRFLMHGGATIQELNCVRKHLSKIKGGRLAAATRAGLMVTLIISDVIGDPLDIIASGPTVADPSSPANALSVLERFTTPDRSPPESVLAVLRKSVADGTRPVQITAEVYNEVIGSNAVALAASAEEARRLGYDVESLGSNGTGEASEVGRDLARRCAAIRKEKASGSGPQCLLSGGEPIVRLAKTNLPRKGGRNQEVVLAALDELSTDGLDEIVLLSGGTDGEDGPTDAAGGIADASVWQASRKLHLAPTDFLHINNSYPFLEACGGLLKTGPTHTNVMDVRVAIIGRE